MLRRLVMNAKKNRIRNNNISEGKCQKLWSHAKQERTVIFEMRRSLNTLADVSVV